jgi:hypothetical protein
LTKIKQWFKVKNHLLSKNKEERIMESNKELEELVMEEFEEEPNKKELRRGAALTYFMQKYAPEATEGSFKIVAEDELRRKGYDNVDLNNLSPEQEELLLKVFQKVSKKSMEEWILGICMREIGISKKH